MSAKRKLLSQLIALSLGSTTPLWALAATGADDAPSSAAVGSPTAPVNNESEDGGGLKTITVTAQKREESAQQVPTPISVLTGDDLLSSGIGKTAAEVLNYVPNASAGTQLHGRPRWWIRGVGTGVQSLDNPNPVGIYFDDVYINNASATGFPLFDLDRVEVLRGPQGTLWGKNTTGGAVNFVSKKPTFDTDGYLKLDYGTFNDRTGEGAFNVPLIDDKLAARGSIHYEDKDGRFNDHFTDQDAGSFTDEAFRFQLLGEFVEGLDTVLSVHYRKYITDGSVSTVTGTGVNGAYRNGYVPNTSINAADSNAPNESDTRQRGASFNAQYQLGNLTLTSITAYEDYTSEALADGDNTPLELSRSWTDQTTRQVTQEFRLTSPREDRWNWVGGAHFFHETIDSDSAAAKLPGAGTIIPGIAVPGASTYSLIDYSHKTTSYALFGSTTFNFTDQFDVTAGLRWTTEKKDLNWVRVVNGATVSYANINHWWDTITSVAPNAAADTSKSWNDWTYDLTPEYKITDNARVYFRYAKGFRAGGFNTAATAQAAIDQGVKPEFLTSYEFGVKSEWFNGRLNANANVFKYNYQDIQVNVVGPLPTSQGVAVSYLQNVKDGKASGAEFDIEALPIENLHINADVGILNTKFTDFTVAGVGTAVTSYDGNRFVRSPHYSAVLGFDYDIPLGNGGKVVAGGDWKYQSKQFYFTTNQTDPLLGSGGYTLGNVRLSYLLPGEKTTFTVYADNVSDKVYRNHALPGSAGATGDTTIYGDPRTAGVSVTQKF